MHFRVRIRHWVAWWFYVGVVCGVIALVNILGRRSLAHTGKCRADRRRNVLAAGRSRLLRV